MTDNIDHITFDDLSRLDPVEVCARTSSRFDAASRSYTLTVWGEPYRITPTEYRLMKAEPNAERDHSYFGLFIVHYLLAETVVPLADTWISEKEIPGGATFFRGPHALPTDLICNRFGNDLAAFKARCEALNGRPLKMADAAYRFDIVPRVPVAVCYWCGDEEFPAEAKLLFDRSLGRCLAADVVFALGVGVCWRLGAVHA
jgi:hypothetical protein